MNYFHIIFLCILCCTSLLGQTIKLSTEDILTINDCIIDSTTTIKEIKDVLGVSSIDVLVPEANMRKPSNGYFNSNYYIFHSIGLVIIENADRKHINHIECYFSKPTWHSRYKPDNIFTGNLTIRDFNVLELSETSFQKVTDKCSKMNKLSKIMCGSFACVFNSESDDSNFFSLSIGTEYNTSNSLGWSEEDKSFFFETYSKDPNIIDFAKTYNCDKSSMIKCMIDKASTLFQYDNYFYERVPPEEMAKVLKDCVFQTQK